MEKTLPGLALVRMKLACTSSVPVTPLPMGPKSRTSIVEVSQGRERIDENQVEDGRALHGEGELQRTKAEAANLRSGEADFQIAQHRGRREIER